MKFTFSWMESSEYLRVLSHICIRLW
jgi:hypothetical protein